MTPTRRRTRLLSNLILAVAVLSCGLLVACDDDETPSDVSDTTDLGDVAPGDAEVDGDVDSDAETSVDGGLACDDGTTVVGELCDGTEQCADGSDEAGCPLTLALSQVGRGNVYPGFPVTILLEGTELGNVTFRAGEESLEILTSTESTFTVIVPDDAEETLLLGVEAGSNGTGQLDLQVDVLPGVETLLEGTEYSNGAAFADAESADSGSLLEGVETQFAALPFSSGASVLLDGFEKLDVYVEDSVSLLTADEASVVAFESLLFDQSLSGDEAGRREQKQLATCEDDTSSLVDSAYSISAATGIVLARTGKYADEDRVRRAVAGLLTLRWLGRVAEVYSELDRYIEGCSTTEFALDVDALSVVGVPNQIDVYGRRSTIENVRVQRALRALRVSAETMVDEIGILISEPTDVVDLSTLEQTSWFPSLTLAETNELVVEAVGTLENFQVLFEADGAGSLLVTLLNGAELTGFPYVGPLEVSDAMTSSRVEIELRDRECTVDEDCPTDGNYCTIQADQCSRGLCFGSGVGCALPFPICDEFANACTSTCTTEADCNPLDGQGQPSGSRISVCDIAAQRCVRADLTERSCLTDPGRTIDGTYLLAATSTTTAVDFQRSLLMEMTIAASLEVPGTFDLGIATVTPAVCDTEPQPFGCVEMGGREVSTTVLTAESVPVDGAGTMRFSLPGSSFFARLYSDTNQVQQVGASMIVELNICATQNICGRADAGAAGDVIFNAVLASDYSAAAIPNPQFVCAGIPACERGFDCFCDLPENESDPACAQACAQDSDCTDNAFCNGEEQCFEGACYDGEPPCPPDSQNVACAEDQDACLPI